MSKVLILVGSPRKSGNTELLANAFAEGAASAHHEVEILNVARMNIAPCVGCNTCFTREDMSCAKKDDMVQVYEALAKVLGQIFGAN
ncbi:MAG: flavodoxin family protein [Fibrobacter sp.]|nr:flavodoxin family protein [Fibrobacter sp.]